jgi:hypothetical protein
MNIRTVATYVLHALARAQREGRASNLETLRDELQVRRADVRAAVSQLHREGLLDALRMRLTLRGFAIGTALSGETLPELRPAAGSLIASLEVAGSKAA